MTLWKTRFAAALTIGLTVVACSLDDLVPDGTLGIDDGASGGAKESYKVDNDSEARIEIKETGATLTVPKGAVEHSVTIGVERPSDVKAIEFVESLKTIKAVASAPYVLTPHGTEFAKDLKLQIPVVANKGKELVAAYLKDESDREWKYLDTPIVEGEVATVTLKHFSVIVLLDRNRAGFDTPDAGSPAARDAGDEQPDAGTSAVEDAGSTASDAGTGGDDVDPATTRPDAGSSGSSHDAGTSAVLDAATPNTTDAGTGSTQDAGSSYTDAAAPDADPAADSGTQILDTGVQVPDASLPNDPDAGDTAIEDAGFMVDSGYDADPYCETLACEPQQCGSVPNGCGGEMGCGNCEGYGGVCNQDQHVCEYIGQL